MVLFFWRTQITTASLKYQGVGASSWLDLPNCVVFHPSPVFPERERKQWGLSRPWLASCKTSLPPQSLGQRKSHSYPRFKEWKTRLPSSSGEGYTSNLDCKRACISREGIIIRIFTKKLPLKVTGVKC